MRTIDWCRVSLLSIAFGSWPLAAIAIGQDFFPIRVGNWWEYHGWNGGGGSWGEASYQPNKKLIEVTGETSSHDTLHFEVKCTYSRDTNYYSGYGPPERQSIYFDTAFRFTAVDTFRTEYVAVGDTILTIPPLPQMHGEAQRLFDQTYHALVLDERRQMYRDSSTTWQVIVLGEDSTFQVMGSRITVFSLQRDIGSLQFFKFSANIGYVGKIERGNDGVNFTYVEVLHEYGNRNDTKVHYFHGSSPAPNNSRTAATGKTRSAQVYSVNGRLLQGTASGAARQAPGVYFFSAGGKSTVPTRAVICP